MVIHSPNQGMHSGGSSRTGLRRANSMRSDQSMKEEDGENVNNVSDVAEDAFENREKTLRRQLRQLYPHMRERELGTYMPRRWDHNQASNFLEVSKNGLCVTFRRNIKLKEEKDPSAIVRANCAIPPSVGLYYFEVTIIHGHRGCLGVGISRADGALNRMPGWDPNCYGYHGDDGNFFSSCGHGQQYGPKFGTGDVIGCGVDTVLSHVFFTKNGKHLGIALEGLGHLNDLFPTVGLKTPGEQVCVNFGHEPFVFDLVSHREELNLRKRKRIERISLQDESGEWIARAVSSYLKHAGATETLNIFKKEDSGEETYQHDFIKQRNDIIKMVLNGEYGVKIETRINRDFPNVLNANLDVQILLMCLRFIDISATIQKLPNCVLGGGDKVELINLNTRPPECSPSSSNSSLASLTNPNKRTRSRDDIRNIRRSEDGSPAKKSPISERRQSIKCEMDEVSKNGDSASKNCADFKNCYDMVMSKDLFENLQNTPELEKMKYLVGMGQRIIKMCQEISINEKTREIVEISLSTIYKLRKPTDPHPLDQSYRKYIAIQVFEMISKLYPNSQFSELRGWFYAWKGIREDLAKNDKPAASLSFMRQNMTGAPMPKTDYEEILDSDESQYDSQDDEKMATDDAMA